jgi:hypothetical protein
VLLRHAWHLLRPGPGCLLKCTPAADWSRAAAAPPAGAGPYLLSLRADATLMQQNGRCDVIWTSK